MKPEVVIKRIYEYKPKGWLPGLMSMPLDPRIRERKLRLVRTIQRTSARMYAEAQLRTEGLLMGFETPVIRIKELREFAAWNTARARQFMGIE